MAEIIFIRVGRTPHRMDIGISDGDKKKTLSVSDGTYRALGEISVGEELSCELYDTLLRDDVKYRAMKRALSILAYADNSAAMLYMKLKRAGFDSQTSHGCVEECLALGYIDERRQLERLIPREAEALKGPSAIRAKLRSRGYSPGMIDGVMEELVAIGEVDFDKELARLIEKKGDGTEEGKKRLMYKHGYL